MGMGRKNLGEIYNKQWIKNPTYLGIRRVD